ncbi:Cytochrome P450 [Saccharopolyspora kobensis]|uniref:Cytochrome P450 n=1 Tax=Saccharopolyspora kobensis TaxID=146035 RepID=A0A1H5ZUJ6_9PSEU|nr:cytochrome P450 [Saccharopolyspora kobensis]SEG39644.1 Cytochrome P450 [Saccharopolyspora kobensis]SFE14118.1 Cytochrome P450 [Saccharopolyspora kobensis]
MPHDHPAPAPQCPMGAAPDVPLFLRRDGFDPAPEMAALREEEGVRLVPSMFGTPVYAVTRHEAVKTVMADTSRFSVAPREEEFGMSALTEEERARVVAGNLLGLDAPEHTRLRRMLTSEFTVRRMRGLQPRITEIVEEHLDAMAAAGPPADLVADFALPIPSLVICELLGVPYADRAEFQERTGRQLDLSLPEEEQAELLRDSRAYMAGLVARAQARPGEDMLGMLVREHGDELTTDELVGIAELLLAAGHETTSNMLGLGTLALLRHPDQLALVRDDPTAVAPAVEELLRYLSIVTAGVTRTALRDVEIDGVPIPAGSAVAVVLATANRDPRSVDDGERLDVTRTAAGHVAFGHGLHHCLGAPLARMEMQIAFPALLRRFPGLALAVPCEEVAFRPHHFIHGLRSLPVRW